MFCCQSCLGQMKLFARDHVPNPGIPTPRSKSEEDHHHSNTLRFLSIKQQEYLPIDPKKETLRFSWSCNPSDDRMARMGCEIIPWKAERWGIGDRTSDRLVWIRERRLQSLKWDVEYESSKWEEGYDLLQTPTLAFSISSPLLCINSTRERDGGSVAGGGRSCGEGKCLFFVYIRVSSLGRWNGMDGNALLWKTWIVYLTG